METKGKILFEITGDDLRNVKKFRKQHKNCFQGVTGERFEYSFMPTGMGLAASVKCSCGQQLIIGNFMDHDSGEYDEYKNRVLTESDHKNKSFEEAALRILQMKNPHLFRIAFGTNQSFDMIYAISAYGIASVGDERIGKCILWLCEHGEGGNIIQNYEGLNEEEKIKAFYNYFEKRVMEEISQYDCRNSSLLSIVNGSAVTPESRPNRERIKNKKF